MSKFIYFTLEEKAHAQNTDLVSLLRAQGECPIRSGGSTTLPMILALLCGVTSGLTTPHG